MMRPISVRLPTEDRQALAELALREYRDPSDLAAFLIVEGLRRMGALPELKTATSRQLANAVTA
jgi:hypothetical protein